MARFGMSKYRAKPKEKTARRSLANSPKYKSLQAQASRSAARLRATSKQLKSERGGDLVSAGAVVVGGAASGVVQGKFPSIAGIDTRWILGAGAVAAGCFAVKGKVGGYACLAGAGMLAAAASEYTAAMTGGEEAVDE